MNSRNEQARSNRERGQRGRASRCAAPLWGVFFGIAAAAASARAQTPEDRATARQLATEGIELYRAEKYEEALDHLERAEALYEAPVHLLYIARAQKALGRWVAAAETYRKLLRTELTADSPAPFSRAVEEGRAEFERLEGRIPRLTVRVDPEGAEGLVVRIDGQELKSAALGVPRLTDPGAHLVEASAPGFDPARAEIELAEGAAEELTLSLTGAEVAGPAGISSGSTPSGTLGLLAALRVGGFGRLGGGGRIGEEQATSDYFPAGLGGELQVGLRFGSYYALKLGGHGFALSAGSVLEARSEGLPAGTELTTSQSARGGSIAFAAGGDPRRLGPFGEAALLFNEYRLDEQLQTGAGSCTGSTVYAGGALRLGGGLYIPVASALTLTPLVSATFGSFTSRSQQSSIAGASCVATPVTRQEEGEFGVYHEIFLGLGGDLLFGESWFR
jgi:tetratricopeptide (TPR) repeat protein